MNKTMVLIIPDEGYIEDGYVCIGSKEDLLKLIKDSTGKQIRDFPLPYSEGNQGFMQREANALLQMVSDHSDWSEGQYVLEPIEPRWKNILLIITSSDARIEGCMYSNNYPTDVYGNKKEISGG